MYKITIKFMLLVMAVISVYGSSSLQDMSEESQEYVRSLVVEEGNEKYMSVFDQITETLSQNGLEFRVVEHEEESRSNSIVEILKRKLDEEVSLHQGAKSMITVFSSSGVDSYNLVVLPGDKTIDWKKLAGVLGVKKIKLAPLEKVEEMTRCVAGTVPPFPIFPGINFVVDESLLENNSTIFFTPGRLDRSIFLNIHDYMRILSPRLVNVIK